jgi:hypothetical protein
MSIGKAATTQALLGNVTVAGTFAVTGTSAHTGNATFGGTVTVTGQTNANGNLQIGSSGTPILAHYSGTNTLVNLSLAAASCAQIAITVTGAAVGDTVIAAPSWVAGGTAGFTNPALLWDAAVSAANTVTVNVCDWSGSAINPVAETWRADVWHH